MKKGRSHLCRSNSSNMKFRLNPKSWNLEGSSRKIQKLREQKKLNFSRTIIFGVRKKWESSHKQMIFPQPFLRINRRSQIWQDSWRENPKNGQLFKNLTYPRIIAFCVKKTGRSHLCRSYSSNM